MGGETGYPSPAPDPGMQPTLGEVAPMVGAAPTDISARFQAYLQAAQQAYAPLKAQAATRFEPSMAEKIMSFGLANVDAMQARKAYMQRLDEKSFELAKGLMQADAQAQRAGFQQQLALSNLQARMAGLTIQQQEAQLKALERQYQLQRNLEGDDYHRNTVPLPTPEQRAGYTDQGLTPVPDQRFPGRFRLQPIPGVRPGTKGEPVAPGSPLAEADPSLAGSPAAARGDMGTAALEAEKERRRASAAGAVEVEKRRAARRALGPAMIRQVNQMLGAVDLLPEGNSLAGQAGRITGLSGAYQRFERSRDTTGPDAEKRRLLSSGNLLIQQMYRLVAVGVATEQDVAPYKERLGNLLNGTREEAVNALTETKAYLENLLRDDEAGTTSTPTTTPTTSTTSTTTPTEGTTPGGIKFRVVQ